MKSLREKIGSLDATTSIDDKIFKRFGLSSRFSFSNTQDGEEKYYKIGDVFDIKAGVPHAFVRVDSPTVVSQRQSIEN